MAIIKIKIKKQKMVEVGILEHITLIFLETENKKKV